MHQINCKKRDLLADRYSLGGHAGNTDDGTFVLVLFDGSEAGEEFVLFVGSAWVGSFGWQQVKL